MTLSSDEASLRFVSNSPDYIEIHEMRGLQLDLRYASTNNFMQKNLYGAFGFAFLHRIAATKLNSAVQILIKSHPDLSFVIYDALRPRSVQQKMWEAVMGTDKQKYIANPANGSIHNFGFALDISLREQNGMDLDMGTEFDDFSPASEPRNEPESLQTGLLTSKQIANRELLRKVMTEAGFIPLSLEWWHFDALDKALVRRDYPIVE